VREPQELERLRLGITAAGSVAGGEPPELDQPRLLPRQLQAEVRAQVGQKPLGVLTGSKPARKSSANRTRITSPRACRRRHRSAHRSKA